MSPVQPSGGGARRSFRSLAGSVVSLVVALFLLMSADIGEARDYLILLDTSGSMAGKPRGETPNIFPEVKNAVARFIDQVEPGSRVVVMPFHQGVVDRLDVAIRSETDRARIKTYVRGLQADGQVTWVYRAMRTALARARELRKSSSQDPDALQMVLLYTDGRDNGPDGARLLEDILKEFGAERGDFPNLYIKYVTLGVDVPPEQRKSLTRDGVELIENERGALRPMAFVEIRPGNLNLGSFAEGDQCARDIELAPVGLNRPLAPSDVLELKVVSKDLEAGGAYLTVEPKRLACNKPTETLRFVLHNRAGLPRAEFEAQLVVTSASPDLKPLPESIQLLLSTQAPPGITLRSSDGGAVPGSLEAIPADSPRELALRVDVTGRIEGTEVRVRGEVWKGDQRVGLATFEGAPSGAPGVLTLPSTGGPFSIRLGEGLAPGSYRLRLQLAAGAGDRISVEAPTGLAKGATHDIRFEVPEPGSVTLRTSAAEPLPASLGDLPYDKPLQVPLRADVVGTSATAGPIRVRAEILHGDRILRDVPLEGGTPRQDGSIELPAVGGDFIARLESTDSPGDYAMRLIVTTDAGRVVRFETSAGPVQGDEHSVHFRVPEPPMEVAVRAADGSPLAHELGRVARGRNRPFAMRLVVRRPMPDQEGVVVRADIRRNEKLIRTLSVSGGDPRGDGSVLLPLAGGECALDIDPARARLGPGTYSLHLAVTSGAGTVVQFETDTGTVRGEVYDVRFSVPFWIPWWAWPLLFVAAALLVCRLRTANLGDVRLEHEGRSYAVRARFCRNRVVVGGAGRGVDLMIGVLPPGIHFLVQRGSPGTISVVPKRKDIRDADRDLAVGVPREIRDGGVLEVSGRRLIVRIRLKKSPIPRKQASPAGQPPATGR